MESLVIASQPPDTRASFICSTASSAPGPPGAAAVSCPGRPAVRAARAVLTGQGLAAADEIAAAFATILHATTMVAPQSQAGHLVIAGEAFAVENESYVLVRPAAPEIGHFGCWIFR